MTVQHITDGNDDGSTMGQSASDKISFHGATPVVQQASAADGTDAATTQTLAIALKDAMVAYGLIA